MNIEQVILLHFNMYPKMRPQDAVKLIYQNEFGGGHMIKDSNQSLNYLIQELEVTPANPSLPLFVPIGNRLVRINLPTLTEYRISPKELNDEFVNSANSVKGSIESLKGKLEILKKLVLKLDASPFTFEQLSKYLEEYEKSDCKIVSHSSEYKEEYAPAYRIISENSRILKKRCK